MGTRAVATTALVGALLLICCGNGQASPHRDQGYLYLSPVPGAPYVSARTRYVLVRFEQIAPSEVANLAADFITVTGSSSGPRTGNTHVASDGRTVIFTMSQDFLSAELVTVTLNPHLTPEAEGKLFPFEYQFMTTAPMPGSLPSAGVAPGDSAPWAEPAGEGAAADGTAYSPPPGEESPARNAMVLPNRVAIPSDFPKIVITVSSNPSPGYLFMQSGYRGVPQYTMMVDNNGLPVWYRRGYLYDFKIQKNGRITWAFDPPGSGFYEFDQNFNSIQNYRTVNGYQTDNHDLEVLEDGSYVMLGNRINAVDMSLYVPGGGKSVNVTEGVIQQFTPAGELIFQWRAWDNYDISQTGSDFPHMNALDVDEDGHLLVSSRHLNEVTKINRDTGEIIWRLGGAYSDFTFMNDPLKGISYQHDISALSNGHYLVFDNGNTRSPQVSRAVEYHLDLTNKTATLVWQFRDTPDKYTFWFGNAQRLPSGNTLINFARPQYPKAIEVDPGGVKQFELSLVPNYDAYRTFRFPWVGPAAVPYLLVEPQLDNLTLIFNKFGDTNVATYRIYGGTTPKPTTLLATATSPIEHLTNLENGRRYYFRVTAVDDRGVESDYSNEENAIVNLLKPGEQMIQNGDFSLGTHAWDWNVSDSAVADWIVTNGESQVVISNGSGVLSSIQLRQTDIWLIQRGRYIFEFDAWTDGPRYIQAKVGQTYSPYADYSRIGNTFVTPVRTHFRYGFTMLAATDGAASVMFNLGTSALNVYLDNISLYNAPAGDINLDGHVNLEDLAAMAAKWPQRKANLVEDLNGDGTVDFHDFVILGNNWSGESGYPYSRADALNRNETKSKQPAESEL